MIDPNATITVGDKVFLVEGLPSEIQEFISLLTEWETDLLRQKKEVFKCEAAIAAVKKEIETRLS